MDYLCVASQKRLEEWFRDRGAPSYRGAQVVSWIHRRFIDDPEGMSDLPKTDRRDLRGSFLTRSSRVVRRDSDDSGVEKFLIALRDGELIEAVVIPSGDRRAFCLSSQVGCPVGCVFCASGAGGLVRNMSAGEIVEQFLHLARATGSLPDNVVFMGVGEPLLNPSHLLTALEFITGADYVDLGHRRITISTSGWTPGIRRLTKVGKPWNLAVSLHAADDETRRRLIPDQYRRSIAEILDAVTEHRRCAGRIPTFEYTLVEGVNDDPVQAAKLAKLSAKCRAKVNLIPCNPNCSDFRPPKPNVVRRFQSVLSERGVTATLRRERGAGLDAACGQLRAGTGL